MLVGLPVKSIILSPPPIVLINVETAAVESVGFHKVPHLDI